MIYSIKKTLTHKRLLDVLRYDKDTGLLTWVKQLAPRGRLGSVAGSARQYGKVHISIDNVDYLAHRLAWLYMTGAWPKDQIDHINRDQSDNRWCNLREATRSENLRNSGLRSDNTSGIKGVRFRRDRGKWEARITLHGKVHILGLFQDSASGLRARIAALPSLHGEYAAQE